MGVCFGFIGIVAIDEHMSRERRPDRKKDPAMLEKIFARDQRAIKTSSSPTNHHGEHALIDPTNVPLKIC